MIDPNQEKQDAYHALIQKVRASYPPLDLSYSGAKTQLHWCEECHEINLWTYWQGRGNLDAKILLVGQDWGCPWDKCAQNTMKQVLLANQGKDYQYMENNPSVTDQNLRLLFRELGYTDIRKPNSDLFFTNFILGYRNKGISGGYCPDWAQKDACYFRELANIIAPKVILCLGRATFEGVLSAFGIQLSPRIKNYNLFIESLNNPVAIHLENGNTAYAFALAHCGAMGTLNRNGKKCVTLEKQLVDWRKIRPYLNT